MTLIWVLIWFLFRALEGYAPELRVLNFWLLTLIVVAVIDALRYRSYITRRWR